jgi:dTDP-4-dehydrorhamnose reductase
MEGCKNSDRVPVWGGIECTIQRIANSFGNQLQRSGHWHRPDDLELISSLGIRTLRFPVLWEAIAPAGLRKADWKWTDQRLEKLKSLNITPIAGLLHHGSGPVGTSLLDPFFPEKFTEFAKAVAERYPWLSLFTPINEPLTTARFSCLYGHWYPHARHHYAFARALVNQCKATTMAMNEIRKIIPEAKLVQTEDLGKCYATSKLQYQADAENERRWCSYDLLTGRGFANTFIRKHFLKTPLLDDDLAYLSTHPCPPDILGLNHYITSERFLDHRFHKYPKWSWGSNGVDAYADVEIVRADISKRQGHYQLLKEASDRYRLPVAFTEVHMGATREEQLRWFMEAWKAATKLKSEGADVRGITAWSLLGAFDWNTLLTKDDNIYEPGAFDVRCGKPRPTAVANLIKQINAGDTPDNPVLAADGWWKNIATVNCIFGCKQTSQEPSGEINPLPSLSAKPIVITGATGTLGSAFARICKLRNLPVVMMSRKDMDIADREAVEKVFKKYEPWAVINAAGFVNIDEAEENPTLCMRENTDGAATLAYACRRFEASYLTFSTDFVFDGSGKKPYTEDSSVQPINIYGVSKYLAECRVRNVLPSALIIRTSSFFGPWDNHNFLSSMITNLQDGKKFTTSSNVISPTYVPDLVHASLDLLVDKASGIWHVSHPTEVSWHEFALMTAEMLKLNTKLIRKTKNSAELGFRAPRPAYSALGTQHGCLMPPLDHGITRFVSDRAHTAYVN